MLTDHLYDNKDWTELEHDAAGQPLNAPATGRVDVRQRNDVVAQDRLATDVDWTRHTPPRSYDAIAFRPTR